VRRHDGTTRSDDQHDPSSKISRCMVCDGGRGAPIPTLAYLRVA
jgi:hypothetical protein